jgi:putative transposase
MDNGRKESFDGRLRDAGLNVNQSLTIEEAKTRIDAWRLDYTHHRPQGTTG